MPTEGSSSAILDLSYRNYDGPIGSVAMRWAVIAKTMILKSFRLKSLWVLTFLSGWYFLAMIIVLFFVEQIAGGNPVFKQGLDTYFKGVVWKDQFFHGFGYSQHVLLIVALLVGAGSIANDNRANALLVYLSKPTRKIDYLFGKWIGVFVPILVVVSLPTLIFYIYGIFTFRDQGFLHDPWLILKELAILPAAAAIHTSLILFVSSLFKQGTVAGAVYAGIYFMGYFFSQIMMVVWRVGGDKLAPWIVKLNFACIDGFVTGFARSVMQPGKTRPFGMPVGNLSPLPNPSWPPYLLVVVLVCGVATWGAWTRIRAVEVV